MPDFPTKKWVCFAKCPFSTADGLNISRQDIFYYPDLLLSCDPTDRETYYRSRPCLLVEVLSDSTARIDSREKLFAYQTIPSLA